MDNVPTYKGYLSSVHCSPENEVFYGRIEADSAKQLRQEFEAAVDDYLAFCEEVGKTPDKAFKGVSNMRLGAELHRKAAIAALARQISLNELM
ncbi:MAG TPA: type II toxin-antitoxin system HicB family antitoxin, partial [Hymenobacter sp.]